MGRRKRFHPICDNQAKREASVRTVVSARVTHHRGEDSYSPFTNMSNNEIQRRQWKRQSRTAREVFGKGKPAKREAKQ